MAAAVPNADTSEIGDTAEELYFRPSAGDRLYQGELLRNVWEWVPVYGDDGQPAGTKARVRKFSVLIAQDCDLAQDYVERVNNAMTETDLRNVLLCPVLPADELRALRKITSRRWEEVRKNKVERYQYLAEVPATADGDDDGSEPLLVDFMSYFCVRTDEIYRQLRDSHEDSARRFAALRTPWREHLQGRFATYLARIGLPLDHFVPETRRESPPAGAPPS